MNYELIKVCGMRNGENIRAVTALGVNWIGMIFWDQSPRNVTMIPTHAGIIPDKASANLHQEAKAAEASAVKPAGRQSKGTALVGVFVDEMAQNIITRAVNYQLDLIQLHGNETPTFIRNLRRTLDPDIRPGIQFIKAISIPEGPRPAIRDAIATCQQYEDCVDYFLFDTHSKSVGGSGKQFDWSVLEAYDGEKPFLLSGGIGPDDAERLKAFHHPKCIGIDLNSRFETEPGMKNVKALSRFLKELS